MSENDEREFSWRTLFLVTGISGFAFSLIVKLLDGQYSNLLLWIGATSTALGLLNIGVSRLAKSMTKKKSSQRDFIS